MRKMHLGLAVLFVGLASVTFTACGGEEGTGESCSDNSGCPSGQTCDTNTGECKADGGGNTPTCTPGCTGGQVCDDRLGTGNAQCVARCTYDSCINTENCNLTTGLCELAKECASTGVQPSTCSYGQYCAGTDFCDFVAKPTCANFTNSAHGATWNPATSTGPIIHATRKIAFENNVSATTCTASAPTYVVVRVSAYRASGTFGTTSSAILGELHYVDTNGAEAPKPFLTNITVSQDGRNATFDANFCTGSTVNQLIGGLHFVNGNEACFTVSR